MPQGKGTYGSQVGRPRKNPQTVGTFAEAFRQAKNSGVRYFMWKGKEYHTRTADEEKSGKDTKKTKTYHKKYKWNKYNRGY
jgi:hypothetical protein